MLILSGVGDVSPLESLEQSRHHRSPLPTSRLHLNRLNLFYALEVPSCSHDSLALLQLPAPGPVQGEDFP
jgi:hypothetical protein